MKIAILTTDSREHYKDYKNSVPYFGAAPEALLQGFAMMPEIEIHVISCVQQLPPSSPEKLADNIWYHALHVPKIGWMRTLYQGCIRATRKKLREIQPDIVHGQGTERDCAVGAAFSGFPNVLTIHGNMRVIARVNRERAFSFIWLAARLEGFTLPRTDGVVCITNHTRDAVADLAKRTWVVPNAVDPSFFEVQPAPAPGNIHIGLCVGTICHLKNQSNFVRALDPLARERNFKIIFLGKVAKSAYGDEFLQLVKERPWCEYAGFAGRDRLKDHLKTASFLALPTLEDNCPMVVLEAMAAGVPVLASNVGGVPDLIEEEKTGLFCEPLDVATMRNGIARLLDDRELSQRLAATAKMQALKRFHPRAIAQRHLEIYREVLSSRS